MVDVDRIGDEGEAAPEASDAEVKRNPVTGDVIDQAPADNDDDDAGGATDWSKKKVSELEAELEARSIEKPEGALKADLVKILEDDDAAAASE